MKLPTLKRLTKQDYKPEEQPFIEKLSFVINNSLEVLFEALNKKVSLRDNIACSVREVTVKVSATGIPTATTSFSLDNTLKVEGTNVIKVDNMDGTSVFPTATPMITFTQTNTGLVINHIAGLPAGTTFKLKIVAYN